MSTSFYLPRNLISDGKTYTEKELLAVSTHIVVLAEPGAGKTELMESFAWQLGTSAVTANMFRYADTSTENSVLVIDAFDELAKLDKTGIYNLLAKAKSSNPTHVIISSRSSEWDSSATNAFKNFLGQEPLVVKLYEFQWNEQKEIFDHHLPGEDFETFQNEVIRFDLDPLLPNPQFLKLFADAYIESGRHFSDKRSIFTHAIDRLAREANSSTVKSQRSLSISEKVELSSEAFAKLLLSGAE